MAAFSMMGGEGRRFHLVSKVNRQASKGPRGTVPKRGFVDTPVVRSEHRYQALVKAQPGVLRTLMGKVGRLFGVGKGAR